MLPRRAPLTSLRAMERDVDLIASWPIRSATSRLEIRRVLEAPPLGGCGRSTVVSTEGVDSGPPDRGSASGACEIGGLGTLKRGLGRRVAREGEGPLSFPITRDDLNRSVTKLWPGKGARAPCTRCLVRNSRVGPCA